ncbi:ribokinase [Lepeophtheirus salmonis]|nr:ribokinase-like [Lepeophtheirus salmonis]
MAKTIVYCGGIFRDEVTVVERFPRDGETVFATEYFSGYGGKSANQSVAASMLRENNNEFNIYFLGQVGCDPNGIEYEKRLKEEIGINTDFLLKSSNKPTGIASISLESSTGENKIIVYKGANELFGKEAAINALQTLKKVESISWVVVGTEILWESVIITLEHARTIGAHTLLNFAPIPDNFEDIDSILKNVSILCVNQVEANALSGNVDIFESLNTLLNLCPIIIITLGSEGAVFKSRSTPKPVAISISEKYKPTKIVDTTGAGDSFIGSLSYYLGIHAQSELPTDSQLEEMIRRACIIAAFSITKKGTQSSYFPRNDLPPELFAYI